MVSEFKKQSNRLNAQKSTGPRTRRGKRRVPLNSSTHGIFCKRSVLPGENRKLFHEIREQTIVALRPQDVVEMLIVDTIVQATWKLRRVQEAEFYLHEMKIADIREAIDDEEQGIEDSKRDGYRKIVNENHFPPAGTVASYLRSDCGTTDRLSRYEQRLHYTRHRAMRELREHRKTVEKTRELPDSPFRETARPYDIDQRLKELDELMRDPHAFMRKAKPSESGEAARAAAGANP